MNTPIASFDVREKIALAASLLIVASALVYWLVQIDGVLAMLKLAYGP